MRIEELKLVNFRNFKEITFTFSGEMNLIYGGNGKGKTSILEAISYLSLPKSRRGAKDEELIKWRETFFLVRGKIIRTGVNHTIEVSFKDGKKDIRVDGKKLQSMGELFRLFVTLYFSSREQNWIDGPPALRRKLVDWYLSIKNPEYYEVLLRYRRNLAHKNIILKNGGDIELIDVYNEKIEEDGSYIVEMRKKAVNEFNKFLKEDELGEGAKILYTPSIEFSKGILKEKLEEELASGVSLYGPHRDRLDFSLKGKNPRTSASEGEKRLLGLSLLLKIRESFKDILGENPPLLLDEPFSILEPKNMEKILPSFDGQVFITAVRPLPLEGKKIELE